MRDVQDGPIILGGYAYMGRVCNACKCPYFEQISNARLEKSALVDVGGKQIVTEHVDTGVVQ